MTARELYEQLATDRSTVLATARECARLTIPSLLPPEATGNHTTLPTPYQSLGAYGVNHLSSKLLLAHYPPGIAFFRNVLPEDVVMAAEGGLSAEQRAVLLQRLAALENRALQKFEASTIRSQKAEVFTHLVVAGNVMTCFKALDDFRIYRLDQYVIMRDGNGKPLKGVAKDSVTAASLPENVLEATGIKADRKEAVHVYTLIEWADGKCKWHEEIEGKIVPDSEGDSPVDRSPWNALRWKIVPGSDYGRGHCEEYLGDLISLEGLSQAIVDFAAIASKVVFLVKPGASTNIGDVNAAQSGEAVAGDKDDISALQLDKYADFQVVQAAAIRLEERLSRAFLLQSGITRDAERVTAEEVRGTAQELEDTYGGVYSVLAQEEQLPFVRRLIHVLTKSRDLPALPTGSVEPTLVTGFQALGRNHALNRLRGFVGDLVNTLGNEAVSRILNVSDIATRLAVGWGVESTATLIKTQEQLAAENAQAQQAQLAQTVIDKAAGPAAKAALGG